MYKHKGLCIKLMFLLENLNSLHVRCFLHQMNQTNTTTQAATPIMTTTTDPYIATVATLNVSN